MARADEPTEPEETAGSFVREHRHQWERISVVLYMTGGILALIGAAGMVANYEPWNTAQYGVWAAAIGLVLFGIAVELGHPLQTYRTIRASKRGGETYERGRRWTRLKTGSILLNLLVILSGVILAGAVLKRFGLINIEIAYPAALGLAGTISLALGATMFYSFHMALRTPIRRPRGGPEDAIFRIALIGAVALGGLASILVRTGVERLQALPALRAVDAPFYMLAGFTAAALAVYRSRALPTIYALFTEERDFYRGRTYVSARKSVILPTVMAFAMLFLVLMALIVFQLGVVQFFETIPTNFVLLGVFAFIAISLIVSVAVAVSLSRSEDKVSFYRVRRTAEARMEITILAVSAAIAIVLLIVAAVLFLGYEMPQYGLTKWRWLDFFTFAILVGLGPFGFYYARKQKRIRNLEERFPDFLRDLAASRRAGLTLYSGVQIAAQGEYGALTPEIQKMADQLSWNVPFNEALVRFGQRVNTPLIQRAVSLINEASRSGGNVTDVLLAAATDAREIKNLENDRRTTMVLYSIVTYITFFVFLVVVAILYGTFIPEILRASQAALSQGGSSVGGIQFEDTLGLADYRAFFYIAALMQGLGNGIVAGLMESGKALTGLRHAFIMAVITYLTFTLVLA